MSKEVIINDRRIEEIVIRGIEKEEKKRREQRWVEEREQAMKSSKPRIPQTRVWRDTDERKLGSS